MQEKKRVSILTFPRAINYGAVLQAVALAKKLENSNAEVVFLDHYCESVEKDNKLFDFGRLRDIKYVIAHVLNMPIAIVRKKRFRRFQNKHMKFVKSTANTDIIVVGSDQVWNYNLTGNDWFYFLNQSDTEYKKVAYAASFGISTVAQEYQDVLRPFLNDFDYIAVREETAVNIIKKIINKNIPLVLDPTLLLTPKQWKQIIRYKEIDDSYIFVYTVHRSNELWDFAYFLSREFNLPIKTVSSSVFHNYRAKTCFAASPEKWLELLSNAEYVVTNSFHGLAFSLNFNKQVYYEVSVKGGDVGSRLVDMADRYEISNQEISRNWKSFSKINYDKVNVSIEDDRKKSEKYIDSFLEN
ncbi:MAG: polysaccharide pyruvyl transferase family protein [Ruminococcaceae bacterium]|nr:polysaccharide pyruvyl transferase family protein [Oscillospiraceae bacterium]